MTVEDRLDDPADLHQEIVQWQPTHRPAVTSGPLVSTSAAGAVAVGALALGVMAIGAIAIGRLAIGAMAVRRARLGSVEIDELIVHHLDVRD